MRMPKYPLWMLMGVLTQIGRASVEQHALWARVPWAVLYPMSVSALLALGYKKIFLDEPRKQTPSSADEGAKDGAVPAVASTVEMVAKSSVIGESDNSKIKGG